MQDKFTHQYQSDQPAFTDGQQNNNGSQSSLSNFWKYFLLVLVSSAFTFVITIALVAVIFISLGGSFNTEADFSLNFADNNADTRLAAEKLQSVYDYLANDYYRELSDAEMLEAMTAGLAFAMDSPYTMYLTPEENQIIEESFSGEYSGIGVVVALNGEGAIEITDIFEHSPGLEVGLQIGDIFLTVDGEDVTELKDISQLAALVRGPENSRVEIEIYRPLKQEILTFSPERKNIDNASVRHKLLENKIGYISVSEFSKGVSGHFEEAVDDLTSQGARTIIFDLRNNSGGLAEEVTEMLDYLLPDTVLARIEGRLNGQSFEKEWISAAGMGVPEDMHYVVLTNRFSASASELFAGCLRDHDKAIIIGEQTFGKGSGTMTRMLEDGSALNITNFLYYLPAGDSIEGVGLTPDIEVELSAEAQVKAISRLTIEEDTQLAAAIEYLNP